MTPDELAVLVVDDSEDDRMLYRRLLEREAGGSFTVVDAHDGDEGMARLQRDAPDCVLLDYSLPGHNGVEVLKQIRAHAPFLPVVMLTGQGNERIAVTAMQSGAQNYVCKSGLSGSTLAHSIRVAVEHCALERRIHEQRASLEVFTRALAHDLKEPLRTLCAFSKILIEEESFSETGQTYIEFVRRAAERMHAMVDTVFVYTRLEDPDEIPREPVDLGVVLAESTQALSRLIEERGARIESGALPRVLANPPQLAQLVENLVCNAIRHGPRGVRVEVGAETRGDECLVHVRDDGPGIDAGYLRAIFEPFKRLSRQDDAGAGLGLAICRRIVEAHGGRIWCESTVGSGACFRLTLPLAPAVAPAIGSDPGVAHVGDSRELGEARLANVLLVDDSPSDLDLTELLLFQRPRLGCNLLSAMTGEEALEQLRDAHTPIDLMLLDINMPGMDGFEVLETMRRSHLLDEVCVAMCTGSTYDKDLQRSRSLGAAGYLVKPVRPEALQQVVERTAGLFFERGPDGRAALCARSRPAPC